MIASALDRRVSVCAAAVLGTAAIVASPGCGGSSPTAPPPPPGPPAITFSPEALGGADTIVLVFVSATATEVTLSLNASNVADLFGYGVDLVFDPEIIAFESAEAGNFLDAEGITVTLQVVEAVPGTLVIGQSRVGAVEGASGSGALVRLRFTAASNGTTDVNAANGSAFGSDGSQQTTTFFGGTLNVPAS